MACSVKVATDIQVHLDAQTSTVVSGAYDADRLARSGQRRDGLDDGAAQLSVCCKDSDFQDDFALKWEDESTIEIIKDRS